MQLAATGVIRRAFLIVALFLAACGSAQRRPSTPTEPYRSLRAYRVIDHPVRYLLKAAIDELTYRLVSRSGPHLVIEVTSRCGYAEGKRSSMEVAGSQSIQLDLDLPSPVQETFELSLVQTFGHLTLRQEIANAIRITSKTVP